MYVCTFAQADKRARQRAKEKERKEGKTAAAAGGGGGGSSSSKGAAAAGAGANGVDSFDAELAAAMAEAAAISSRWGSLILVYNTLHTSTSLQYTVCVYFMFLQQQQQQQKQV